MVVIRTVGWFLFGGDVYGVQLFGATVVEFYSELMRFDLLVFISRGSTFSSSRFGTWIPTYEVPISGGQLSGGQLSGGHLSRASGRGSGRALVELSLLAVTLLKDTFIGEPITPVYLHNPIANTWALTFSRYPSCSKGIRHLTTICDI